ncbi:MULTISPECIES: PLDc N-terminal domain-containing protein [Streptococcus]|uniref:PLDc N-terminal domain-containing protein n=1 Tax=Streptococcus pacificus TaxID=2740577 RepID=A0ABS0ZHV1_9STRE|nr:MULTISPECIES: PLDc N-terminal domain-containing protein [Streptococcus]MBJ8325560.1 PLDc N-terminal domain-containing protein [Streptococcus pacificus]MCU9533272.1 PLDc N-terminal domain-containing protein [Streptococcus sp. CSL10205-OR2]
MNSLKDYLPALLPIIFLEVILMIFALKSVLKQEKFKFGNKAFWIVIVIIIQILGPILYFVTGREEK